MFAKGSSKKLFKILFTMKKNALITVTLLLSLAACKPGIKPEKLYGKWKYTRVEHPAYPSDSLKSFEIDEQKPYIVFNKNSTMQIVWSGKELSHGTYTVSDQNIMVTEALPGGKTRKFLFAVSELTDNKIIFATLGEEGSRVTAVR
jgi:hypothetical protein